LRATMRRWRTWDRRILYLACWALFPLVFFSFSHSKLPGYILPCIAPLALLVGARFFECLDHGNGNPRRAAPRPLKYVAWAHLTLATALALVFPVMFVRDYGAAWGAALPISAACLLPAIFTFYYVQRGRPAQAFSATAIQGVVMVLALAQFAFPALGRYQSARDIAQQALSVRQDAEPIVTYNFFNHALNYYAGYRVSEDLPDPMALGWYAAAHPRFLIITDTSHLPEISGLERDGRGVVILGEQGRLRLLRVVHPK
jgi:4-amino-4-deoxy-L-arabinose transferase-like glycosyltransferase